MSNIEQVEELLADYCTGGYGNGLIGEANIIYLVENYPELVRVQRVYRLGDTAVLTGDATEENVVELLEELRGLQDYPVLCEDTFSELQSKLEEEFWVEFVEENDVEESVLHDVLSDGDYYFDWEQDYVYPAFDVEELVDVVQRKQQTWQTHYIIGKHISSKCLYCADAQEVVA